MQELIPTGAKQQGEAADALIQKLNDAQNKADDATLPPPSAAQQANSQENQQPATEEQSKTDTLEAENAHLKQALSTLQGKYSAEVPELSRQLREARAELQALHDLRAQRSEQQPAFDVDTIRQEYGDDMVAIAESAQAATQQVQELTALDEARRTANEKAQAEEAQRLFNEQVEALIPDFWSQKNNDPAWHSFLEEYTPSGETWRAKAEREMQQKNAQGIASIYSMYEASKALSAQQPDSHQPADTPQPEPQPRIDPREQLVPPKTTGGNDTGDKRVWTSRDVNTLYAEKDKASRGQSRFTLAELEEQEKDLFAAQSEGRFLSDG
ncbi:hypothetical protein [Halodesulfovibrio sp.]|uniref:hypothetical protein n=1 Tax=Halodesulfovibrio sp. TaxID=1912772 RepID=UPI0025F9F54C|nr:hypothetical protein [Halodesulfovibrio sp.]MCT4627944.1 hypothetical protein [Halodesulfovibrio sp.]